MVTQITPHHAAYFHSTPNSTECCTAEIRTAPTEDARHFRFIVSFPERSRVPLVAHVTLSYGPIGWRSSSWAELKEEGEKNIFPLRFLIFQR